MDHISVRIKTVLDEMELTVPSFSKKFGLSDRSMYNYVKGINDPPSSVLSLIGNNVAGLSAHWLLTGNGKPWGEREGKPAQVAIGNGNKQHMGLSAECLEKLSAAEREIGLLKQILAEKERVILLLEKSNQ